MSLPAPDPSDPFAVIRPLNKCREVQLAYLGIPFEPISTDYARTLAAALVASADAADAEADS